MITKCWYFPKLPFISQHSKEEASLFIHPSLIHMEIMDSYFIWWLIIHYYLYIEAQIVLHLASGSLFKLAPVSIDRPHLFFKTDFFNFLQHLVERCQKDVNIFLSTSRCSKAYLFMFPAPTIEWAIPPRSSCSF